MLRAESREHEIGRGIHQKQLKRNSWINIQNFIPSNDGQRLDGDVGHEKLTTNNGQISGRTGKRMMARSRLEKMITKSISMELGRFEVLVRFVSFQNEQIVPVPPLISEGTGSKESHDSLALALFIAQKCAKELIPPFSFPWFWWSSWLLSWQQFSSLCQSGPHLSKIRL